jgi:hypothetical protein
VPTARLGETLFAGAFPTGYLSSLTARDTARFGESEYPAGDFQVAR